MVIAILGILAALMFPAITKAQYKAKETTKRNNLRSIWQAHTFYLADNNGYICPVIETRGWEDRRDTWTYLLGLYLGLEEGMRGSTADKMKVFIDPLYKGYNPKRWWKPGYAMNAQGLLPDDGTSTAFWNEKAKARDIPMANITYPEKRIFIGDANNWFLTKKGGALSTDRHRLTVSPQVCFLCLMVQ